MIRIDTLHHDDRAAWTVLWEAYLRYYDTSLPPERFERTWSRLMVGSELMAFGARHDDVTASGELVGIVHYLFHPSCWMNDVCYLQDLYVSTDCRGQGAGRMLIEAVATAARAQGAGRLYWMTQQQNAIARGLYDRIARFNGFIRYDYDMAAT